MANRSRINGPETVGLDTLCSCCHGESESTIEASTSDALFQGSGPFKVLFIGDSKLYSGLEVERERDKISQEFMNGAMRSDPGGLRHLADQVCFVSHCHKDLYEVQRIIFDLQPVIFHLACHGERDGRVTLRDSSFEAEELSKALIAIADKCKKLRLLILNFCWSGHVAKRLREHFDFIIANDTKVEDEEAVKFSRHFYFWMGNNEPLEKNIRNFCRLGSSQHAHLLSRRPSNVRAWDVGLLQTSPGSNAIVTNERQSPYRDVGSEVRGGGGPSELSDQLEIAVDIARSEDVEDIVAVMVQHQENARVQDGGSVGLRRLAGTPENLERIFQAGGIEAIVSAMGVFRGDISIQKEGCAVLSKLASLPINRPKIGKAGGIEAIVAALEQHKEDPGLHREALPLLVILVLLHENQVGKRIDSVISVLVSTMTNFSQDAELQAEGCSGLKKIAGNCEIQLRIGQAGGIEAIVAAMEKHRDKAKVQCEGGGGLRRLADN
eukprot:766676-Hanusia_phi.AAC.7